MRSSLCLLMMVPWLSPHARAFPWMIVSSLSSRARAGSMSYSSGPPRRLYGSTTTFPKPSNGLAGSPLLRGFCPECRGSNPRSWADGPGGRTSGGHTAPHRQWWTLKAIDPLRGDTFTACPDQCVEGNERLTVDDPPFVQLLAQMPRSRHCTSSAAIGGLSDVRLPSPHR